MNRVRRIISFLLAMMVVMVIYSCDKAEAPTNTADTTPASESNTMQSESSSETGYPFSRIPDCRDLMVIKYDSSGKQAWMKLFEESNESGIHPVAARTDDDGNFYLTGYGLFRDGINGFQSYGTLKYDSSGSLLETIAYPGLYIPRHDPRLDIMHQDRNGTLTTYSTIQNDESRFAIVRYDNTGNLLWSVPFADSEQRFAPPSLITVDASGNTHTISYSRKDRHEHLLLTLDKHGDLVHQAVFYSSEIRYVYKYAMDAKGNIYIMASDKSAENIEVVTVKFDSEGRELWYVRYAETEGNDVPSDMAVDEAGNVSILFKSHDKNPETDDLFVTVQYDAKGNKLWERRYAGDPDNHSTIGTVHITDSGGTYGKAYPVHEAMPEKLASDGSGNVYIAGLSDHIYAVLKYDSAGNELWASLGNNWSYMVTGIALDMQGNVSVSGTTILDGSKVTLDTFTYNSDGKLLWKAQYNQAHFQDYPWLIADEFSNVYLISSLSRYEEEKYP